VALASLTVLTACGGGGGGVTNGSQQGGAVPIIAGTSAPAPSVANSNVGASDTAADWTDARYDPSGSGNNALQSAITESDVTRLAPRWIFNGTVGSLSSVAVLNGVVYRTEEGGNVYAISESTGTQVWNYAPVPPEGFNASPLVAAGNVYLASTTGDFYVVGQQTGEAAFQYAPPSVWGPLISGTELRAHYRAGAVYSNGTVYIGASNHVEPTQCMQGGQVMALDPLSPNVRALANFTPNGLTGVGVWSLPVFDANGDMFVAAGNSCDFSNAPYGDSMIRLDPNSLSVLWSTPGPPNDDDLDFGGTPVVVANEVVGGAKDGYVYAYDTSSGQLLWKRSAFPSGVILASLATDGNYIVVPYTISTDQEHAGIAVFDLQGNIVWSTVTGDDPQYPGKGMTSSPAISRGMIFVGYTQANCSANCDGLGAFDIKTGKSLWWYSTPSPIMGGVAVVQGGVFANEVGNPTTYCFLPRLPGSSANAAIVQGTHRGSSAYFHNPWLTRNSYDGDNSGPLRP
jgi:outer membrane protein assembly factor BamB